MANIELIHLISHNSVFNNTFIKIAAIWSQFAYFLQCYDKKKGIIFAFVRVEADISLWDISVNH